MTPGDSRPPSSFEGSYAPGAMLAGRYRIVAMIGEGGMGEVYLADDLTLGQEVAIKFLPERLAGRDDITTRFHEEVRLARKVSHHNVARVHDIGEIDGRRFLTMEFVDGEDLSRLLKRIGRFPREKAVDIAQQLCAGLAAAHEQGVMHRDLKPANIMFDGQGRVKITDFGLATAAGERGREGVIVGTPAYMSPEQITGGDVDERSEVYSLGLVLYELFTGKRVFDGKTVEDFRRLHMQETPSTPSTVLADIDPVVERVIMRCLEKEPAQRPKSVRAVALALPGGDPLAAAVAAGETPAPELVAEAGERGGLSAGAAVAVLLAFLGMLSCVVLVANDSKVTQMASLEEPPQVLVRRAQDILESVGHDDEPMDSLHQFHSYSSIIRSIEVSDPSVDRWTRLGDEDLPVMHFLYRQGPQPLVPFMKSDPLTPRFDDPPHIVPGMARIWLDARGRLISLSVVPPARTPAAAGADVAPDWSPLFEASGLVRDGFVETEPTWTPDVNTDARFAWTGGRGDDEVHVEAGAFAGRPVYWSLRLPWVQADTGWSAGPSGGVLITTIVIVMAAVLIGGAVLARRNLRLKRGDRKGAARLAVFSLVVALLAWLLGNHHVASGAEISIFFDSLAAATLAAMFAWVFYLAVEPELRRMWPKRVVSWVRLLDGRFRDPLVGRDLLLGCLIGTVLYVVEVAPLLVSGWLGLPPPRPDASGAVFAEEIALLGGRHHLALFPAAMFSALNIGLTMTVLLVVSKLLLRATSIAIPAFLVIGTILQTADPNYTMSIAAGALFMVIWLTALLRIGLLTVLVGMVFSFFLAGFQLTFDASRWYAANSALVLVVIVAVAVYGFWVALAGRPILADVDER